MDDLISRQAAIDAIDDYMVGKNCAADGTMIARLINELVIKRLPSATDTNVGIKLGMDVPDTNVGDMISRQAAIDALFSLRYTPGEWVVTGLSMCVDALSNVPSAQPEIIRCKDCKWHEGRYRCLNFDVFGFDYNDYCSLAERREDGTN